ncbi:hypothetical protein I3I95_00025 [bacterium]|nr:hypothetical protein [bacterium]
MREVRVSDVTMRESARTGALSLTFKEKLEVAKQLDRLGVSVIEIEGIEREKVDHLRIKSIASLVKNAMLAVPVKLDCSDVDAVWESLAEAQDPRLQVIAPVSPAQIEYLSRKKTDTMATAIVEAVAACAARTSNVEFVARDATRADMAYLCQVIEGAIEAGATTVTVCDAAGAMLPEEFAQFMGALREQVPSLAKVKLGISCSNEMYMADACAIAGIIAGADEVKASSYPLNVASVDRLAKILADKADQCQATCRVRTTEMRRVLAQISWICEASRTKSPLAGADAGDEAEVVLTAHDDLDTVVKAAGKLGYDLSAEDAASVYEAFMRIATKKESVSSRELDAIVASAALQVPPTYVLERYVINSGNVIRATACVQVKRGDEEIETVAVGDGPIDAAFLALEKIAGRHYELDDFQIQSVTQGTEAMGQALIKLESDGKLYSGLGISTDIVGSSIRAYMNALNKIVYEEQE